MNTVFLLMAQYEGQAVIPLDRVCKDYFSSMELPTFMRKLNDGKIDLPVMRMEKSHKAARGVHIKDLAQYIEARREEAAKMNAEFHR